MIQKAPGFLGSGALRIACESPLTRDELGERIRLYAGSVVRGGQPNGDSIMVASTGPRGFVVMMRGGALAPRPLTAGSRWVPADRGSAFTASILPARSTGSITLQLLILFGVIGGLS